MTILPRAEADYVKVAEPTYTLELTEKEVKRIGERRYMMPRRFMIGAWVTGPGLVITIVGSTVQHPSETLVHTYGFVLLAGVVEAVAAITYFWLKTNRAGKAFLKEQEISKGGQS